MLRSGSGRTIILRSGTGSPRQARGAARGGVDPVDVAPSTFAGCPGDAAAVASTRTGGPRRAVSVRRSRWKSTVRHRIRAGSRRRLARTQRGRDCILGTRSAPRCEAARAGALLAALAGFGRRSCLSSVRAQPKAVASRERAKWGMACTRSSSLPVWFSLPPTRPAHTSRSVLDVRATHESTIDGRPRACYHLAVVNPRGRARLCGSSGAAAASRLSAYPWQDLGVVRWRSPRGSARCSGRCGRPWRVGRLRSPGIPR